MNKSDKTPLLLAILAFAAILVVGIIAMSPADQSALAKKKTDNSTQALSQNQLSGQSSDVFSENGSSTASGNNVKLSFNLNEGQNALGQQ